MAARTGYVRSQIGLFGLITGVMAVSLAGCGGADGVDNAADGLDAPVAEQVVAEDVVQAKPPAIPTTKNRNARAKEGRAAKREEGRVGVKGESEKRQLDKQLAGDAGVLGLLSGQSAGDAGSSSDAFGGGSAGIKVGDGSAGGLIGAKGVQIGSGGLGSRGSGLGGGGGMTGLGSKGIGSGASGYGSGSGYGRGGGGYAPSGHRTAASPRTNTEQYTNYGVNDVQLAEQDRLSTFSVDVDTASYTISRSKLASGSLPPTSAVRVEEFVNYFDYAYAPPKREAFGVHLEAVPNPWVNNHHLLRIGVKGKQPKIEDKPVKLTFLVDVSGSMNAPGKLSLAKKALHYLVDQSSAEDSIALATYAGSTREVLQPTPITQKARIHKAIDSLSSGGGTAMEDGMTLAYGMARDGYLPGAENRVIVLSDGDANIGNSGFQGVLRSIEDHAGKGITMSTIGFGRGNYKDTMMEQLANKGDGNYYYIDTMSEARKVFGTDLAGTTRTIARDVKLQVAFNPDTVLAYRLIGYENRDIADADFRNDKVDAGEIGSGHEVTALYDVVLADDTSAGLGEVRIRHKQPGPDQPATEGSVPITSSVVRYEFGDGSRDLKLATGAAMFAEVLRGSEHVEELSLDQVAAVLRPVVRTERERELLDLVIKARDLGAGARPAVTAQAGVLGSAR